MPSRNHLSAYTAEANAATSRKRSLSIDASSSAVKRPKTKGGFVLDSDDSDENGVNEMKNHVRVSPRPASPRGTLQTKPTPKSLPTKQLNKSRIQALLGRNKKSDQSTQKASSSSLAQQPLQRSMSTATHPIVPVPTNSPQENLVPKEQNEKAKLSQKSGKQFPILREMGVLKQLNAVKPRSSAHKSKTTGEKPAFIQRARQTTLDRQLNSDSNSEQQAFGNFGNFGAFEKPTRLSKLVPSSSKQPLPKSKADCIPSSAGDVNNVSPKKQNIFLASTGMDVKAGQKSPDCAPATGVVSERVSTVDANKVSPPIAHLGTKDTQANSNKALDLSQSSGISADAIPYFEYSISQKQWYGEQDEKEAFISEITVRPFTSMLDANAQAERYFQTTQQYPGYMTIEQNSKRDEHGCIVLTSTIAPFEYPSKKHHTRIYVKRDYVSELANQTPHSVKDASFISDTGYILRLFKLIDSDDSDTESGSDKGKLNEPVRVYHPHGRPEVYTTLQGANHAARSLQIELSHEKNPTSAMTKRYQEQDLKKLNEKSRALEAAGEGENGCWRSKFNACGLGGDKLELVVDKAGICGPRNI
ncbi:hypothetical protein COCC4DRAFT_28289 [Bipolaris maydis ATCC 48331]|uniref:Uncharacterized protein n=2 Tax=Cochliobolus heterostrophus TaxID=5016 RepID=M2UCG5_COCH5|nr:uncharacterized protein COCC4DRAFT_28289 [Bipolaris maydis ATCC 48331]EMD85693.1 hypothetical protein COCHEDRAFT_1219037 [Bipolaris maydis C5]KAJ5028891.1 hypothetical protein J3E73DRAFT_184603 [Bipolaris maydis]ENH99563.1 hypothetical protein COCC4DRAFT_28289 [Bipolaris maydis ATCC 48331]KAJ5063679.1 hypothetical protein J3E74DRAFT_403869 [Bipolaris maydis]KAJ6199939.1 hypothetical protein J3E72DRAFT_372982 [Bipolaris maydis]